jgi:hypothetical protein
MISGFGAIAFFISPTFSATASGNSEPGGNNRLPT